MLGISTRPALLGTIRVLLLAPAMRETSAVIIEAPILLGELVRLPLVRGSPRCQASGTGSIIDGLDRVPGADVG